MGQEVPLSPADKAILKDKNSLFPELQYLNRTNDVKLELAPLTADVNNTSTYVISIATSNGALLRNYYDIKTGLKVRTVSLPGQEGNEKETTTDFTDYRDVNGVQLPFTITTNAGGYDAVMKVKKAAINSGVGDEIFK